MAVNKPGVPTATVSDKKLKKVVGDIEKMLNKTGGEVGRAAAIGTVLENFASPKKYLTYKVATRNLSKLINQLGKQTDEINALANISDEGLEAITKVSEAMGNISSPMKVRAFNLAVKSFSKNTDLFKKIGSDKQVTDGIKNIVAISKAIEPLSSPLKVLGVRKSLKILDGAFDQFSGKNFENVEGIKDLVDAFSNPMKIIGAKLSLKFLGKSLDDVLGKKADESITPEPVKHRGLRTVEERDAEIAKYFPEHRKQAKGGIVSPKKAKSMAKVVKNQTVVDTPDGPNLVGEAGPEAIVPLNKMSEVAADMSKGSGTSALASGQQEMIDNQENLNTGQSVLQNKSSDTLRQISDIKNTLSFMAQGAAIGLAGKVMTPEAESVINGIISHASLIGTALFAGFGVWLGKEHPELGMGLKHVVSVGRTVAKYSEKIKDWFPKIGKVTEKLTKWGDDIMKWGKNLMAWPLKMVKSLQNIPIIGKMFSMGTEGAMKAGKAAGGLGKKAFGKLFKMVLKKLPFVGLGVSLYNAWEKWPNDKTGAALEVASGLASMVPGIGTAVSAAIDLYLAKDAIGSLFSGGKKTPEQLKADQETQKASDSARSAAVESAGKYGYSVTGVPGMPSQKQSEDSITVTMPVQRKFGTGAIVNKPTPALVGESGREAIIPLGDGFKEFGNRLLEHMGSVDGLKTMTKSMSNGSVSEQASMIKGVERDSITEQIAAMLPMLMAAQSGGGGQTSVQSSAPPTTVRSLQSSDGGFMNQLFKFKFNM